MNHTSVRKIRKTSFTKKIPLSNNLLNILDDTQQYFFLKNPPSQNIFLYLIDFIQNLSEVHFNKPLKDLKILDWGCGKGQISYLLKDLGANVSSCDADDGSDDSAFGQNVPIIKKGNIEVIPLKHAYLLPFASESFDVVLSFGVLEHVPNDLESLKEIHRTLKSNGLFFCFFLPYKYSWTQKLAHLKGDFYHDRFYDKAKVEELLKISGFSLLDFWHRALLPKNTVSYPLYRSFESLDQILCSTTPLKHLATNVEFVSVKI